MDGSSGCPVIPRPERPVHHRPMSTQSPTAAEVVTAYHDALAKRDFETAGGLLRDDLRFQGPFDQFESAADYLTAIQGLWGSWRGSR